METNLRSGEGYGYFSFKENTVTDCSLLTGERRVSAVCANFREGEAVTAAPLNKCCEVIQLDRITGSDPVHAGSNPALAAISRVRLFHDGNNNGEGGWPT